MPSTAPNHATSFTYQPVGDAALLVTLGSAIDIAVNRQVHTLRQALQQDPLDGYIAAVPAYCTLLVHFDLLLTDYQQVLAWVKARAAFLLDAVVLTPRRIEIPVVYGGKAGPDLDFVADYHHIAVEEVVRIHSSVIYQVYMLGFTPGFAYLGGMDFAIATPRLPKPRTQVPAGSVGIAGEQTGVYPLETPGGWRIIGGTPLRLFDPLAEPPVLLAPGDEVRFIPIRIGEP
jgi:inhibitor of KinA